VQTRGMKSPPIAEEILRLRKEIVTKGVYQFCSSNIEKINRLNELIKRANNNEQI
tara:strand:- start:182 stop:346 length:165 start_codon:yes stop_codon:yes gene_type:complete